MNIKKKTKWYCSNDITDKFNNFHNNASNNKNKP